MNKTRCSKMNQKPLKKKKNRNPRVEEYNDLTVEFNRERASTVISTKQKKKISSLKDRIFAIIQLEEQEEKTIKSEESLRELWDTTKRNNLHITGVPEGRDGEKVRELI